MNLLSRKHWIFDMDGTLTIAAHDFASFKAANGLPLDRPILEVLAEWPEPRASAARERLYTWEEGIARSARQAADALPLLEHLRDTGHVLGILTRNNRDLALLTLRAAGLSGFFPPDSILGRDCATPKPSPDGINTLLQRWNSPPCDAVMVGDYLFDLLAGRAAGTATVLIDRGQGAAWTAHADVHIHRLDALLDGAR